MDSHTVTGDDYLPITGGTITGPLTVDNNITTNKIAPPGTEILTVGGGALTPVKIDALTLELRCASSGHIKVTQGSDNTPAKIENVAEPENDTDSANKAYVDEKYTYSTTDLESGVSPLETGKLYFVYE